MNDADDARLATLLRDAAARYEPAPDLWARVQQRARRHGRRVQLLAAAAVIAVVATTVVVVTRSHDDGVQLHTDSTTTAPPAGNAVDWSTPLSTFTANDFRIEAAGRTFDGHAPGTVVHNDPGRVDHSMTFEREWDEDGIEMRLYIYFQSDGTDWWSNEIRIRNGSRSDPEWVTFDGDFFRSRLGRAFDGDLDLPSDADTVDDEDGPATMHIAGLHLEAFVAPAECAAPTHPYVLEVIEPSVNVQTEPTTIDDGGSPAVMNNQQATLAFRLRDRRCDPVDDMAGFRFEATPADPAIVRARTRTCTLGVAGGVCEPVTVEGIAPGEATVRIDVHRTNDDAIVASGTTHVSVTP
ncbi:MAG: hypothetical protein JO291_08755 [Acidimicrobiia bacterium]|nr:hypothetical protein [Acidimicrobiia bacterium]